jgi:hypothetical protein
MRKSSMQFYENPSIDEEIIEGTENEIGTKPCANL